MKLHTRTILRWGRLLPFMAGAIFVLSMLAPGPVVAQGVAPSDSRAAARLDSIAMLLAGLPPTYADHAVLAQSGAWKIHSSALQASWAKVRDGQRVALTAWRNVEIPQGCPGGQTLLYPFSGPDFLNAQWLFPDCANIVMFGLEKIGVVPDVEAMTDQEFEQLLTNVRGFMTNLFARNYFVTDTMLKNLRKERLNGVVPVFMVTMKLSGAEVLRVVPIDTSAMSANPVQADGSQRTQGRKRKLRGVTIEFRNAGSSQVRHLHYFSLDATDAAMDNYPQFLDYLRALAPTTTLIKSASYLLHGNEFSRLREVILETSQFIVQDDTGMPYARLRKHGWQLRFYGVYDVPIKPFENAYQPSLAAAYEKQEPKPVPLPFRFGYLTKKNENRSNLMVARQPSRQAQSGAKPVR